MQVLEKYFKALPDRNACWHVINALKQVAGAAAARKSIFKKEKLQAQMAISSEVPTDYSCNTAQHWVFSKVGIASQQFAFHTINLVKTI